MTFQKKPFIAYFGGKPNEPIREDQPGLRTLIVSILLTGNFIFMMYRAALTSELSVWNLKMPFRDLQELSENPQIRY